MVYCVKCGTKNPDDAKVCSQCGAPLYGTGEPERRRYGSRGEEEPYRRMRNECFGIPRGGAIVGLIIGAIIIFGGINIVLRTYYGLPDIWWPSVLILFGILFIVGAIYALRRRY
jgi:uncharacterized membrane protein YvbJ